MSRMNKVERGAMQGTPVTGEPATQPSSGERIRNTQDGAQATLQRVQLARNNERHFATRSKSTSLSSTSESATLISTLQDENHRLKEENGELKQKNRRLNQQQQIMLSEFLRQTKAQNGPKLGTVTPSRPHDESLVTSFHPASNGGPVEFRGEQSATASALAKKWQERQLSATQRRASINLTAAVTRPRVARTHSSPTFQKKDAGAAQSPTATPEPLALTAGRPLVIVASDQPSIPASATRPRPLVSTLRDDLERILAVEAIDECLASLHRTRDGVKPLTPPRVKND